MATKKKQQRPKQERGKRTRENLLQAAIQSLVENNIYGLRFAQISKIAEVPQPLMDYHFPSLEALLMEMIQHELERYKVSILNAVQAHATKPRKALEVYIRSAYDLPAKDEGFRAVWSALYHLAAVNKNFAEMNSAIRKTGNERISQLITGIVATEKRKNLSNSKLIQETATNIQVMMTGTGFVAGGDTSLDYKNLADLAVRASFQVLEANFPA